MKITLSIETDNIICHSTLKGAKTASLPSKNVTDRVINLHFPISLTSTMTTFTTFSGTTFTLHTIEKVTTIAKRTTISPDFGCANKFKILLRKKVLKNLFQELCVNKKPQFLG